MLRVAQSWSVLQGLASEQAHIFTPRASSPVSLDEADFELIPAKVLLLVASRLGEYGGQDFCIFPVFQTFTSFVMILNKIRITATIFITLDHWKLKNKKRLTCLLDAGEDRSVLPLPPHRLVFADPTSLPECFQYFQILIQILVLIIQVFLAHPFQSVWNIFHSQI